MDTLTDRVAVVTGGANGIGVGLAKALAEAGMKVVVADIDTEGLDDVVADLTDRGVDAFGVAIDVSDPVAVQHLRDATFDRFGTAHVLCNNAGIGMRGLLTEPIDLGPWHRVFDVDFFAILHGLDAFLPRMLEQGEGHIVNTSSRQGLIATPHLGPYPPAKFASVALTEMLHAELADLGTAVSASVLTPGGVLTGPILAAKARHDRGELDDPGMKDFLVNRVANAVEPIEVGRLVVRAIRARCLYINTHRETLDWLRERVERITADADALGTLR